jgi:hypothetical protein
MDADGNVDIEGIACAEGGAGWWRNPGRPEGEWRYNEIDASLKGPKDIFCSGEIVLVASLFSDVFVFGYHEARIPSGFTSCWIQEDSTLVLAHKLGFLVFLRKVNE